MTCSNWRSRGSGAVWDSRKRVKGNNIDYKERVILVGQPLLRRTLSLQMHELLRQRIAVQYHLEGLSREELDAYLAQQLKAAGITQPLFDDTARQALYQATKGILRKVNKLALTALRLAASRKASTVEESILLDATSEALL